MRTHRDDDRVAPVDRIDIAEDGEPNEYGKSGDSGEYGDSDRSGKAGNSDHSGDSRMAFPQAVAGAILATTSGLLAVFLTSSLAPLLHRDLGVTAALLGILTALFFASSSLSAPLCGRLVDRLGSVRMMRLALILSASCLAGIGAIVDSKASLAVVLCCAGVANGAIQPAANRYLGRLVPHHRQGLAFGIKQSAIPAAMLAGGLATPVAVFLTGWRAIYLAGAVIALVLAALIRVPQGSTVAVPTATTATTATTANPATVDEPGKAAPPLSRMPLIVLAVGWALASAGSNAMGSFFVLGSIQAGYSHTTAGVLVVAGSLASISVRVSGGVFADRMAGSGLSLVAAMSAAGGLGIALLATQHSWAFAAALLLGYGLGSGWGGLFSYAIVSTHPSRPGRASGITQAGASAGACLGPLTFGLVAAHAGYTWAWLTAGALLLIAVGIIMLGRHLLLSRIPAR
ncbi:MFS transporter [Haloactinomyces albus]|uniref:MFS family permease n=1 Tax=Haloactinomyces albus TaxID=1352928 RepID=A0AAE3ZJ87_9ACTN|nr:MFS transporter [Haloactinomyces albus]MDR7304192.1 MFS family permease [Haloactinomyces albus]